MMLKNLKNIIFKYYFITYTIYSSNLIIYLKNYVASIDAPCRLGIVHFLAVLVFSTFCPDPFNISGLSKKLEPYIVNDIFCHP